VPSSDRFPLHSPIPIPIDRLALTDMLLADSTARSQSPWVECGGSWDKTTSDLTHQKNPPDHRRHIIRYRAPRQGELDSDKAAPAILQQGAHAGAMDGKTAAKLIATGCVRQ
jgi:hypothetical protein